MGLPGGWWANAAAGGEDSAGRPQDFVVVPAPDDQRWHPACMGRWVLWAARDAAHSTLGLRSGQDDHARQLRARGSGLDV